MKMSNSCRQATALAPLFTTLPNPSTILGQLSNKLNYKLRTSDPKKEEDTPPVLAIVHHDWFVLHSDIGDANHHRAGQGRSETAKS